MIFEIYFFVNDIFVKIINEFLIIIKNLCFEIFIKLKFMGNEI